MNECVLCDQFAQNTDEKFFILKRTKKNVVMLNRFPYNAGHLMVLPLVHKARLHDLDKDTRLELMELATQSARILEKRLEAQGLNIGMNLGKVAGAGIPSHLHMHVLPRFHGDTNFLPILGQTKQISFNLDEIYHMLKPEFESLTLE